MSDGPASASAPLKSLPAGYVDDLVAIALSEDLGEGGDVTTRAVVSEEVNASARFTARQPGVLAGLDFAEAACRRVDGDLNFIRLHQDGARLAAGESFAVVEGAFVSVLTVERTALNFLTLLSGVATLTARYAGAIAGTGAVIVDTRKTLPGLRLAQKYAVLCGGGVNHRMGLHDAILIKDNHIAAAGGVTRAVSSARMSGLPVQVEVDDMAQLGEALSAGADSVLLDNFTPEETERAVHLVRSVSQTVTIESSGGISLSTVRGYAEAGVDRISVGALTHSAPALDIGLDFSALV